LEVLGIDPVRRLVAPRVLASTMMIALLLNGLVVIVGIVGGWVATAVHHYGQREDRAGRRPNRKLDDRSTRRRNHGHSTLHHGVDY
jgi:Permease MlaE